jgi:hypothetical protein
MQKKQITIKTGLDSSIKLEVVERYKCTFFSKKRAENLAAKLHGVVRQLGTGFAVYVDEVALDD